MSSASYYRANVPNVPCPSWWPSTEFAAVYQHSQMYGVKCNGVLLRQKVLRGEPRLGKHLRWFIAILILRNNQELKKRSVCYLNSSVFHCGEPDYLIRPAFVGSVSTERSTYPRAIMKAGVFTKHFSLIAVVLHKRLIRCKCTIWSTSSEEGYIKSWWVSEQSILWVGILWNFHGNR